MKHSDTYAFAGLLASMLALSAGSALADEVGVTPAPGGSAGTTLVTNDLAVVATASTEISSVNLRSDATAVSTVVFDNSTAFRTVAAGASAVSTSSTPNTFMGDAYVLTPGTTSISGFDLYPVNASGTNFTGLKINIFVWGTVNLGAVSAGSPAFSNLLASYTLTSSGAYTTGFYFPFESATPGSAPGIELASPLSIPSTMIGVTVNYQGTTNGVTYSSLNNLTSVIAAGAAPGGVPPAVGTEVFVGYYRNANSETNGNFTSTLRSLAVGTYATQSLALRVYAPVVEVPEPGTWLMMALGVGTLLLRHKRR
jgi:hypothetical protein